MWLGEGGGWPWDSTFHPTAAGSCVWMVLAHQQIIIRYPGNEIVSLSTIMFILKGNCLLNTPLPTP